ISSHRFEVKNPTKEEQLSLWEMNMEDLFNNYANSITEIVAHFDMSASNIHKVIREVTRTKLRDEEVFESLWANCCVYTRPNIDELAQRIETVATWEDIVLPDYQIETLKEIAEQVKHRYKVYREWGFDSKSSRGFGISALFAGASGTGKTMAAEVLANELNLDLYRIDLSQVVNKYIGETEKNLKRIFDSA
ncbi:MAG: ATP-binding protein, partial [Bacteroidota bacterium]